MKAIYKLIGASIGVIVGNYIWNSIQTKRVNALCKEREQMVKEIDEMLASDYEIAMRWHRELEEELLGNISKNDES